LGEIDAAWRRAAKEVQSELAAEFMAGGKVVAGRRQACP